MQAHYTQTEEPEWLTDGIGPQIISKGRLESPSHDGITSISSISGEIPYLEHVMSATTKPTQKVRDGVTASLSPD